MNFLGHSFRKSAVSALFGLAVLLGVSCSDSKDTAPNPNEIDKSVNQLPVGTSAADFLRDTEFDKLVVEIQYVEGYKPTTVALNNLKDFLLSTVNKSAGIIFKESSIPSPGLAPYSVDDIKSIEDQNRTEYNSGKSLAAYIFFADGDYNQNSGNSKVLGIAYRNTSMAIFEATVHDLSDQLLEPDREILESTIIHHEFGHVLGLVANGSTPQSDHQDVAHGHHCDVEECLMNWVVQTGDVIENLASSQAVPELDSQCQADLQFNGGK
ncbi:MAG: hypothetical protein DHS20C17_21020 [Cyclobacteriaceae bacterium]|nr:MAG: hypothetical protein DHS20C17_21020 [Cyclobacteriaceae bacterium]